MSSITDLNQRSSDASDTKLGDLAAQSFEKQMRFLRFAEMCERKTDLQLLVECFYSEASTFAQFDGLVFTPADEFETLRMGRMRQIRTPFSLDLGGEHLGKLVTHSRTPLASGDVRDLEDLLAGFVYPLKVATAERQLRFEAWIDECTGMNNRLALEELLPREMMLSRDSAEPLSLLTLDLDQFHKINEHHGEEVGDNLILAVADTLVANLRSTDIIFRLEADRFAVILGSTDFDDASIVSERLRTCIDLCFSYQNVQVVQNASAGVTEMVEDDLPETLLSRSEAALDSAKSAGGNRVRFLAASESF